MTKNSIFQEFKFSKKNFEFIKLVNLINIYFQKLSNFLIILIKTFEN